MPYEITDAYMVDELHVDTDAPARCGECGWTGKVSDLEPIESCALDAGDPSPAGRCPGKDCGMLAYIEKPPQTFTPSQVDKLKELLWGHMKRDPEHRGRVMTGWGTKTAEGLVKCIERIAYDQDAP